MQYYVKNKEGIDYGPTYDLEEAHEWAGEIDGWVETEYGTRAERMGVTGRTPETGSPGTPTPP
jgi:hypothetical protein